MRLRVEARAIAAIGSVFLVLAGVGAHAQMIPPPLTQSQMGVSIDGLGLDQAAKQLRAALKERASLGPLDGTWEGTLEIIAETPSTPQRFWHLGDRPQLQLLVAGGKAEVRVKGVDWRPVLVGGGFQALDLGGSGFVYAIHSASGWAENWNLSVTKTDAETLLVFLSFVAGGSSDRLDEVTTEFAVGAVGALKLVAPSAELGPVLSVGPAITNDTAFDGAWEGRLDVVHRYGADELFRLPETATNTMARLTVRGEEADVFLDGLQVNPGSGLRVARYDSAVLVYATFPLGTWQWSLTKLDADTALAFAWRVGDSSTLSDALALGFLGELKRVSGRGRRNDR